MAFGTFISVYNHKTVLPDCDISLSMLGIEVSGVVEFLPRKAVVKTAFRLILRIDACHTCFPDFSTRVNSPGVRPVICLNTRLKLLGVLNPVI